MGELSRREFLERSAITAGVAGAAASLPVNVLLREASKAQASPLPSPRNTPIDHFVVVMMENRSFDHYFGWLSNVADATQQQTYVDPQGNSVSTRHASTLEREWQGCGHPDPGHGTAAAPSFRTASSPRAAVTTSSPSPTTTAASSRSCTRRRAGTRSTTSSSARC